MMAGKYWREIMNIIKSCRIFACLFCAAVFISGGLMLVLKNDTALAVVDNIDCSHGDDDTTASQQFGEDQKFCDGDYDKICGYFYSEALKTEIIDDHDKNPEFSLVTETMSPDCVYAQQLVFTNGLTFPVTITYLGYADWGPGTVPGNCPELGSQPAVETVPEGCSIAPFIAGALNGWASNEGMTLQPGESTAPFYAYVGMPWFVGNESIRSVGFSRFTWGLVALQATPIENDNKMKNQNVDDVKSNDPTVSSLKLAAPNTGVKF
jgi:hypothetical protein